MAVERVVQQITTGRRGGRVEASKGWDVLTCSLPCKWGTSSVRPGSRVQIPYLHQGVATGELMNHSSPVLNFMLNMPILLMPIILVINIAVIFLTKEKKNIVVIRSFLNACLGNVFARFVHTRMHAKKGYLGYEHWQPRKGLDVVGFFYSTEMKFLI